MNEKPVKVDIDFNEALRRIAKTPNCIVRDKLKSETKKKKKAATPKKSVAAKGKLAKQH